MAVLGVKAGGTLQSYKHNRVQVPKAGESSLSHPELSSHHIQNIPTDLTFNVLLFVSPIPCPVGAVQDPVSPGFIRPKFESDLVNFLASFKTGITRAQREKVLKKQMVTVSDPVYFAYAAKALGMKDFSFVKHLNLTNSKINLGNFKGFIRACSGLLSVDFTLCKMVDRKALREVRKKCLSVESVSLKQLEKLQDPDIAALVAKESPLRSFSLLNCLRLTDGATDRIARSCIHLTFLDLSHCRITANSLITLGSSAKQLTGLRVAYCRLIEEPTLSQYQEGRKSGWEELAAGCINLTALDASRCKMEENTLMRIGKSRSLQVLHLSHCDLTDARVAAFCEMRPPIRELDFEGCEKLTAKTASSIAAHLPHLENVNFDECLKLNDDGVVELSQLPLRRVNFGGCAITDRAVIALSKCDLEHVSLSELSKVTDDAVATLAKCVHLETANFFGCSSLSNKGLIALGNGCHVMRNINLGFCPKISNLGMNLFAKLCRRLEFMVKPSNVTQNERQIELYYRRKSPVRDRSSKNKALAGSR